MTPRIRTYLFLAGLLWSSLLFALPPAANAGVIVQAPTYVGLSSGLVGYWSFNAPDMAGTDPMTVFDRSGQGNTASTSGTSVPTRVAGKIGQALQFDGTDVIKPQGPTSLSNNTWSAAFWLREDTFTNWQEAFSASITDHTDTRIRFETNSGGTLTFFDDFSLRIDSSSPLLKGVWYYIEATYDYPNQRAALYINGQLDGIDTSFSQAGTNALNNVRIGCIFTPGDNCNFSFNGSIDEVRIYNRALSPDEVKRLYKIGGTFTTNATRKDTLTSGLVGHWSFDGQDVAGVTAYDRSGNGNNGTLTNGPARAAGKIGQALSFDGVDDYATAITSPTLEITDKVTVSAWVKPSNLGDGGIVGKYDNQSNYNYALFYKSGAIAFEIGADNADWETDASSTALNTAGAWYHVVGTYDRSFVRIYVNGIERQAVAETRPPETANIGPLCVGSVRYDCVTSLGFQFVPEDYFDGQIDEVRIYNRALTADEVKRLYNMGGTLKTNVTRKDVLTDGLVGYWTFDGPDMAGVTALDRSGQGNAGTLTGGPARTAGKIGQALSFDGLSLGSYVSLGNSSNLRLSTGTISAWIKTSNGGSSYRGIVAKQSAYGMFLKNNVFMIYDWGSDTDRSTGINLADGNWHHVAFSLQSGIANGTLLYIDGILQLATTMSIANQSIELQIGYANTNGQQFAGLIDDVRIYNRALSADEIKRLYTIGR